MISVILLMFFPSYKNRIVNIKIIYIYMAVYNYDYITTSVFFLVLSRVLEDNNLLIMQSL